jgi:hypothetical protein
MDIQRVYLKFTDRVNTLSSNHGQAVGGLRQFVDCFNEAQLSVLTEAIQADEATDDLQELLQVFVRPKELSGLNKGKYYAFVLPADYEHYKTVWGELLGECTGQIDISLRRLGEASKLYNDPLYGPSAEWKETFGVIANNELRVYVKDFGVKVTLDYYKQPDLVDIAGYSVNGVQSTNVDPELTGRHLERVLDRAARIHLRNVGDPKLNVF